MVLPALDWALDPNGDGDFSDHLDIVNLSLGSDYGAVDDPENAVIDQLAKHGVLPVISAGNDGDLTDTGGSPGNAVRSLAVASSVDAVPAADGLKVNAPADVAGVVAGQISVAYPWATAPASPATWSPSPSGQPRWLRAVVGGRQGRGRRQGRLAGVGRQRRHPAMRIGGARAAMSRPPARSARSSRATLERVRCRHHRQRRHPGLPAAQGRHGRAAAGTGRRNAERDVLRIAAWHDQGRNPAISDTVSSVHLAGHARLIGVVKPDVAAPGDTIASAGMGSGNGVVVESGTSMATPHDRRHRRAGEDRRIRRWTPEQIKAAMMNTAGHDLYTGPRPDRRPLRTGSRRRRPGGRAAAVSTHLLAYSIQRQRRGECVLRRGRGSDQPGLGHPDQDGADPEHR